MHDGHRQTRPIAARVMPLVACAHGPQHSAIAVLKTPSDGRGHCASWSKPASHHSAARPITRRTR